MHGYFSGTVQGVGFRFSCRRAAYELGVAGWVRNLGDGRVEILAEAEEGALREFLERIHQAFASYIANTDIQWRESASGAKGFKILF